MLTKTQLKILDYLMNNKDKYLGIRELAKEISSVYYLVQRNIHQLKEKEIISLQNAGKTNIISINPNSDKEYLMEVERYKRIVLYKKYPYIKVIVKKIIEQAKSSLFIILLFGSYAKQQVRKDSDIDLLIIVSDEKDAKLMENIVSSVARVSTKKIHDVILTEDSFLSLVQKKELNVAVEIKEKHVILYGIDNYYKLIK